jgi:hypothetical protein
MNVTLVGVVCGKCKNHVTALACSSCGTEYSYGLGNPLKREGIKYCEGCGGKFDKPLSVETLQKLIHSLKS